MAFLLSLSGVLAGVVLGVLAGYRLGRSVRGRRRSYWGWNAAAVVGCAALDFVGLVLGWHLLAYASLGLMGGLITGLKYGSVDSIRVWQHVSPVEEGVGATADPSTGPSAEPDADQAASPG